MRLPIFIIVFVLFSPLAASGAQFESGPRRVGSAWNVYRGGLSASTRGRFYTKQDIFTGPNNIESGVTVWDSQTSFGIYWGMLDHLEIGVVPLVSQKNHLSEPIIDIPGDVMFYTKFGSIGAADSKMKFALQFDARFPTGSTHNIPLNPYSASAIGFGGTGLFSMSSNPPDSATALIWDVNLGYFNHNDKGLVLTNNPADTLDIEASSQQVMLGAALRVRGKKFGFFTEIYGAFFLQPPPAHAFSLENSLYVSPGFSYQFNPYIRIESSVDFLLLGKDDETSYFVNDVELAEKPWETLPNYPDWRFNLGINIRLKQGAPPKVREKLADDKAVIKEVDGKEQAKSKKEKEREIKALEERMRTQNKNKTIETEEQRRERMQIERERMEALLIRLREGLQRDAEAAQKRLEIKKQKEAAEKELEAQKLKQAEQKNTREKQQQETKGAQNNVEKVQSLGEEPQKSGLESQPEAEELQTDGEELQPESEEPQTDGEELQPESEEPQTDGEELQPKTESPQPTGEESQNKAEEQ